MTVDSKLPPHLRERDTEEERQLITELVNRGYPVSRKADFHIKILDVNYYFPRGRIVTDPCICHKDKGFEALLTLLEKMYPRPARRYSSSKSKTWDRSGKSETLDESGMKILTLTLTKD